MSVPGIHYIFALDCYVLIGRQLRFDTKADTEFKECTRIQSRQWCRVSGSLRDKENPTAATRRAQDAAPMVNTVARNAEGPGPPKSEAGSEGDLSVVSF